jgi:hypothetical protein
VTDHDWTVVAAAGQAVAAVASVAALFFVGFQIRMARKTADLQALQEFLRSTADHERRLLDAKEGEIDRAFFELLNFLETNAAALNGGLYHRVSGRMVSEKLRDSVALIQGAHWHAKFEQAITTDTTLCELAIFMKRNRRAIARVVEMRAAAALEQQR